ncbi:MAG: hypothetical protein AB9903_04300 [Vulcanimicrobiota bacterium]
MQISPMNMPLRMPSTVGNSGYGSLSSITSNGTGGNNGAASTAAGSHGFASIDEFISNNNVLTTIPFGYADKINFGRKCVAVTCGYLDMNNNGSMDVDLRKSGSTITVAVNEPQTSLMPINFQMYVNGPNSRTVVTREDIGENSVYREEWVFNQGFLAKTPTLQAVNTFDETSLTDFAGKLFPDRQNVNWAIDLIGKNLIIFEGPVRYNQPARKELEAMVKGLEKGAAHVREEDSDCVDSDNIDSIPEIERVNDWLIIDGLKLPVKS